MKKITRRDFLKTTAKGLAGLAVGVAIPNTVFASDLLEDLVEKFSEKEVRDKLGDCIKLYERVRKDHHPNQPKIKYNPNSREINVMETRREKIFSKLYSEKVHLPKGMKAELLLERYLVLHKDGETFTFCNPQRTNSTSRAKCMVITSYNKPRRGGVNFDYTTIITTPDKYRNKGLQLIKTLKKQNKYKKSHHKSYYLLPDIVNDHLSTMGEIIDKIKPAGVACTSLNGSSFIPRF